MEWRREQWDLDPDSIALALESLSPRTSSAIIREAFYGTRRFDEFLQHCGVSSGVLAARLRVLVDDQILEKVRYQEAGARARNEYRLRQGPKPGADLDRVERLCGSVVDRQRRNNRGAASSRVRIAGTRGGDL